MNEAKDNKALVLRALEKLDSIDTNITDLKETLIKVSLKQDHDRERIDKIELICDELKKFQRDCPAKKDYDYRQGNRKSLSWWFGLGGVFAALLTAMTAIVQLILQKV